METGQVSSAKRKAAAIVSKPGKAELADILPQEPHLDEKKDVRGKPSRESTYDSGNDQSADHEGHDARTRL